MMLIVKVVKGYGEKASKIISVHFSPYKIQRNLKYYLTLTFNRLIVSVLAAKQGLEFKMVLD